MIRSAQTFRTNLAITLALRHSLLLRLTLSATALVPAPALIFSLRCVSVHGVIWRRLYPAVLLLTCFCSIDMC